VLDVLKLQISGSEFRARRVADDKPAVTDSG
jgi:hypothetical protein